MALKLKNNLPLDARLAPFIPGFKFHVKTIKCFLYLKVSVPLLWLLLCYISVCGFVIFDCTALWWHLVCFLNVLYNKAGLDRNTGECTNST